MDQLRETLNKIPIVPLLLLVFGYMAWGYYSFETDPASDLGQKRTQLETFKKEGDETRAKIKKAQEFFRTLEARKAELRKLALELEAVKANLSETLDIPLFIRMVVGEARKVGITVDGIKPTDLAEKDYFVEQTFGLKFHGVYVQFVVFLQRLANLERIVRIGNSSLKPTSTADKNFVQLEGTIELKTYKYKGSKADEVGKPAPAPSTEPAKVQPGTQAAPSGGAH